MLPFEECAVCGGEVEEREVEKLLRGGPHTAIVRITAEVCLRCGERLYTPEAIRRFEQIRAQLERDETSAFLPMGRSFSVVPEGVP